MRRIGTRLQKLEQSASARSKFEWQQVIVLLRELVARDEQCLALLEEMRSADAAGQIERRASIGVRVRARLAELIAADTQACQAELEGRQSALKS